MKLKTKCRVTYGDGGVSEYLDVNFVVDENRMLHCWDLSMTPPHQFFQSETIISGHATNKRLRDTLAANGELFVNCVATVQCWFRQWWDK